MHSIAVPALAEPTNTSVAPRQRPRGQTSAKVASVSGILPLPPVTVTATMGGGSPKPKSESNPFLKQSGGGGSDSGAGSVVPDAAVVPVHSKNPFAPKPFSSGTTTDK